MKGEMNIYYDEEGDFLEINIGGYNRGYFKNLGRGIFKRIDEKTKKVTGIAIMGFRTRMKNLESTKVTLPVKIQLIS